VIGQTLRNRYRITTSLGKGAMGLDISRDRPADEGGSGAEVIARDLALEPEMLCASAARR